MLAILVRTAPPGIPRCPPRPHVRRNQPRRNHIQAGAPVIPTLPKLGQTVQRQSIKRRHARNQFPVRRVADARLQRAHPHSLVQEIITTDDVRRNRQRPAVVIPPRVIKTERIPILADKRGTKQRQIQAKITPIITINHDHVLKFRETLPNHLQAAIAPPRNTVRSIFRRTLRILQEHHPLGMGRGILLQFQQGFVRGHVVIQKNLIGFKDRPHLLHQPKDVVQVLFAIANRSTDTTLHAQTRSEEGSRAYLF